MEAVVATDPMLSLRLLKPATIAAKTAVYKAPKSYKKAVKVPGLRKSFLRHYADAAAHNATKLKLSLNTPVSPVFVNHECTTVGVPGSVGEFAISPNGSPMFAELQPGVIRVIDGANEVKYFVSGGFVASNEESQVNISVGECVRLDDIDVDAARKIANASQAKMSSAANEQDRAIAQIGFDTATAMIKAWESK